MASSTKYYSVSNINLSGESMLKMNMRKAISKYVKLNICKLWVGLMQQVISFLESLPSYLLNKGDTKPIILATGCSRSYTGFRCDFLEGDIVQLCHTYLMGGIGTSLGETHKLILHYEVINDEGGVSVL